MLDIKLPEFEKKVYPDLELSLLEPSYKINLRGKNRDFFTKAGKLLSIMLPIESNTSANIKNINALWLSPDEWLIYGKDIDKNLEINLNNEISKLKYGSVTNVSDQWVIINFKGKKNVVAQTLLNHVDVILHHQEINDLNLFVRKSFSEHLWLWINDSSRFI